MNILIYFIELCILGMSTLNSPNSLWNYFFIVDIDTKNLFLFGTEFNWIRQTMCCGWNGMGLKYSNKEKNEGKEMELSKSVFYDVIFDLIVRVYDD